MFTLRLHLREKVQSPNLLSSLFRTTVPPGEACDVVVAVVDLQVVGHARGVVLQVKVQEVQADALAVAHADVPVADLLVLILLGIPRGPDLPLLLCQNAPALLGCARRRVELVL